MYNGCSWLPELLKLSGSVNDEEVENELYEIYLHELKNGNIVYRGKPVKFRSNPPLYGKEEGFFHIIAGFRGKPVKEDRARRLVWGKYILANEPCSKYEIDKCCEGLWIWKSDHNDAGTYRISIFHPKVSYLVILEERKDYWLYITSYRIDSSKKKRELKLEYKKNKWP